MLNSKQLVKIMLARKKKKPQCVKSFKLEYNRFCSINTYNVLHKYIHKSVKKKVLQNIMDCNGNP